MTHPFDLLSHMDLSNVPDAERLRKTYGSWFERYPLYAKQSLQQRLPSDGAWFELLLHELLVKLGCEVKVTDFDNNRRSTDFLVRHNGRSCYVEATTVNASNRPFVVDSNLEDALRKLNTLSSSDFRIRLIVEGKISRTLGRHELMEKFGKLLSENDPVKVQEQVHAMGKRAAPHAEIKGNGWSLRGELQPIYPQENQESRPRELIIGPFGSFVGDASLEVRRAVSKKAKKYRHLASPLVVAVDVLDGRFDREAELAALFGQEQIQYFPGRPDRLGPVNTNAMPRR